MYHVCVCVCMCVCVCVCACVRGKRTGHEPNNNTQIIFMAPCNCLLLYTLILHNNQLCNRDVDQILSL